MAVFGSDGHRNAGTAAAPRVRHPSAPVGAVVLALTQAVIAADCWLYSAPCSTYGSTSTSQFGPYPVLFGGFALVPPGAIMAGGRAGARAPRADRVRVQVDGGPPTFRHWVPTAPIEATGLRTSGWPRSGN